MRGCRGKGSRYSGLKRTLSADGRTEAGDLPSIVEGFKLTLSPHVLVAVTVTGDILRARVARLLLVASKHVLEEVELGVRDRDQQDQGPQGLAPVSQHFQRPDWQVYSQMPIDSQVDGVVVQVSYR